MQGRRSRCAGSNDEGMVVDLLGVAILESNSDNPVIITEICCCRVDKAETALGILPEDLWDADEQLVLIEHVVRDQSTGASRSAHDL